MTAITSEWPDWDFLLLVPAASAADPKAKVKFEELVAPSREATGTKHPGPLSWRKQMAW